MKNFSLSFALWVVCFCTAWAFVGLDLQAGQRTTLGSAAGVWLAAQAIGLALSKLSIGIPDNMFWHVCADSPDGGIDNLGNRHVAWFVHGLLNHFSLIPYPKEIQSIPARMKITRK